MWFKWAALSGEIDPNRSSIEAPSEGGLLVPRAGMLRAA